VDREGWRDCTEHAKVRYRVLRDKSSGGGSSSSSSSSSSSRRRRRLVGLVWLGSVWSVGRYLPYVMVQWVVLLLLVTRETLDSDMGLQTVVTKN
jgi:hypothetical protein